MTEQRMNEAQARLDAIPDSPLYVVKRDDDLCMSQVVVATVQALPDAKSAGDFVGGGVADPRIVASLLAQRPLAVASAGEKWDAYAALFAAAPADLRDALAALRRARVVLKAHESDENDENECGLWHECSIILDLRDALDGKLNGDHR